MDNNYSILVLDLDGTISDPSLGIGRCLNHALQTHGFESVSDEFVHGLIGPPLDQAFRACAPTVDDAQVEALVRTYRERYSDVGYSENTLYDGMARALEALHASGVRLGVCTSKREDFARRILDMFGLLPLFEFVSGGDIGIPKSSQLTQLLADEAIDQRALMIGDRAVDIQAAAQNGLAGAGVLWGFGDLDELQGAAPAHILEHVQELTRFGRARAAQG